jgi:hypothetical protein
MPVLPRNRQGTIEGLESTRVAVGCGPRASAGWCARTGPDPVDPVRAVANADGPGMRAASRAEGDERIDSESRSGGTEEGGQR